MRKWGILISCLYLLILIVLLLPFCFFLAGDVKGPVDAFLDSMQMLTREWGAWITVGVLVAGQVGLLCVSVDTKWRHLKPRTHIVVSCAIGAVFFASLSAAAIASLVTAAPKGSALSGLLDRSPWPLYACMGIWAIWAVVFGMYRWNRGRQITQLAGWLLKGSVLELLIVVPCHVIVRRRNECCAPFFTSFGIFTGISVMLLSFGPGILFLVLKRLASYPRPVRS